jgi:hypothetical protein
VADEDAHPSPPELESREPTLADLRDLCRELNRRNARYLVIGGFAMAALGYNRRTMDIDLLVDTTGDNESRVLEAVSTLPDGAARELKPGEIAQWTVVRVGDEIVVDLMHSACGIDYSAAQTGILIRDVEGVAIPFASAELLWRMKKPTHREKDIPDLLFLREWFRARDSNPPEL